MKILKQVEGSKIVLYSFETERDVADLLYNKLNSKDLIIYGTKSELLKLDDEFWKPLVQGNKEYGKVWIYKDYVNGKALFTPSESGRSAISDIKGEFILITQEKI